MIIIGLGNPTQKHSEDRHNIGWMVLDAYVAKANEVFTEEKTFRAALAQLPPLTFAKPDTYMNDSGIAAKKLFQQFKELPVLIYDDIDIPLGEIKCSFARGAGGHNGVQSVIDHLGTKEFFRIRIGVRPVHEELQSHILPPDGFQNFLLKPFAPFEHELKMKGIEKAIAVLDALKTQTFQEVMNTYN